MERHVPFSILAVTALGLTVGRTDNSQAISPQPKIDAHPNTINLNSLNILPSITAFERQIIREPVWKPTDHPVSIEIPKINFSSNQIERSPLIPIPEGGLTYLVPDDGIATPQHPLGKNLFIFGHSRLNGEMQDFARIVDLERNDEISVRNERGEVFKFKVEKFVLVNLAEKKFNYRPLEDLVLTMQTSAKSYGEWILDEGQVLEKAGTNLPDNLEGDLVLIVIAKPGTNK